MKTSTATKVTTRDVPGTTRVSPDGHMAILTTDQDDAPWYIAERHGNRYWATHEEVADWTRREANA